MGGHDCAAARGEGGTIDLTNSKPIKANASADNIHDRIHCPHFMEMNRFRGDAMNRAFGDRQLFKDLDRPVAGLAGQFCTLDEGGDFGEMAMGGMVGVLNVHLDFRALLAVVGDRVRSQRIFPRHAQPMQLINQVL